MSTGVASIFYVVGVAAVILLSVACGLVGRRWLVMRRDEKHTIHLRIIRAELLQSVARNDSHFLIDHWSRHDRKAAVVVSSQLLGLLQGAERERLIAIIEENGLLRKRLMRINRARKGRRLATVRELAAFSIPSVHATMMRLMADDPDMQIQLEAAAILARAGMLPPPWQVIRSVCPEEVAITPAHRQLFRSMMPEHAEAFMAIALYRSEKNARLLAIDALASGGDAKLAARLAPLLADDEPLVRIAVLETVRKIGKQHGVEWVVRGLLETEADPAKSNDSQMPEKAATMLRNLANDNELSSPVKSGGKPKEEHGNRLPEGTDGISAS